MQWVKVKPWNRMWGKNWELLEGYAWFRKSRGTRDQIANIHWIIEKAREFQKNICFTDYTKVFYYVDHNKLWTVPDHVTCLLWNLSADQEATVRTGHGTRDWFKTGKGACQGCILSPCLFNLHAEYIIWNSKVDEAQVGIKAARRNINNLRYADDTTIMAESEVELKSLLMKVKEESEKTGLKLNIQKTKIMANRRRNNGNSNRLYSWAPKSLQIVTATMKLKDACSLEEKLWQI